MPHIYIFIKAKKDGRILARGQDDFEKSTITRTLELMLKQMLMRKMLKSQLKDVPEAQQEMLMRAFEKNPKLFENIAKETKAKMKEGKDQNTAAMEVMQKYQSELMEALK